MLATEEVEGTEIETINIDGSTALAALNRSEIDMQITTAKAYPRSIKEFKRSAMELATLDEETAASMFYKLPRSGKMIEGPSVRLAEVVGTCWGNIRYDSDIIATDDKFITAMGSAFDLEKNVAVRIRVKRRITNSRGVRFNDDMIQVTSNAACSIALRQAIFKVVPFALIKGIYEEAKLTSIGKAQSMQERRNRAFEWFNKAGATSARILQSLGRKGLDDVTIDDLITLTGLRTAIKDGEATVEDAFPIPGQEPASQKTSALNEKLKAQPKPPATKSSIPPSEAERILAERAAEVRAKQPATPAPPTPVVTEAEPAPIATELPTVNTAIENGDEGGEVDPCQTWEGFAEAMESIAKDRGISPDVFDKGIGAALMLVGKKGKAKDTSIDWRTRHLTAFKEGRWDPATGRIEAAQTK